MKFMTFVYFSRSKSLFVMFGVAGPHVEQYMDHRGTHYHTDLPRWTEIISNCIEQTEAPQTVEVQPLSQLVPTVL